MDTFRQKESNESISEAVTRAQKMCLKAESEKREAQKAAALAQEQGKSKNHVLLLLLFTAAQSHEKEKTAIKEMAELSRKLTFVSDQMKKLKAEYFVRCN